MLQLESSIVSWPRYPSLKRVNYSVSESLLYTQLESMRKSTHPNSKTCSGSQIMLSLKMRSLKWSTRSCSSYNFRSLSPRHLDSQRGSAALHKQVISTSSQHSISLTRLSLTVDFKERSLAAWLPSASTQPSRFTDQMSRPSSVVVRVSQSGLRHLPSTQDTVRRTFTRCQKTCFLS